MAATGFNPAFLGPWLGDWLVNLFTVSKAHSNMTTYNSQGPITANPGGGQANATPITSPLCVVGTVATTGDSVSLPPSNQGGQVIILTNATTTTMQVFAAPGTSDTINVQAGSTGVTQAQRTALYMSPSPGAWYRILSN